MLLVQAKVFDETIAGTASTWFTSSRFFESVGASDCFAIHACVSAVSGIDPRLTIFAEHSSDAQNWNGIGQVAEVNNVAIVNDSSFYGARNGFGRTHGAFLRFNIRLGGTAPQCRLQLHVTGRVTGASGREALQ